MAAEIVAAMNRRGHSVTASKQGGAIVKRKVMILAAFVFVVVAGFGTIYVDAAGPGLISGADAVERIISAGKEGNRAMGHLDYLVNTIGSRPVGSGNFLQACKWAYDEFQKFGLENVHLEQCGEIKGYVPGGKALAFFKRFYRSSFGGNSGGETSPIFNVIADIPGTELPDEYVIVGAHLDCAPQGPGATDNGTGVAAVMEASRILSASEVKPRRTIRFILFGGEEVGLVGSKGYIEAHPELVPKISAVYNMDHGANFISGIDATEPLAADLRGIFSDVMTLDTEMPFEVAEVEYLPAADPNCCAALVQKMEESGMRRVATPSGCGAAKGCSAQRGATEGPGIVVKEVTPGGDTLVKHIIISGAPGAGKDLDLANFDLEALGITPQKLEGGGGSVMKAIAIGSSDHAPFLAAGIPAFWWNQEENVVVPYPAHTAEDTYDKVNARYLEHSATVIALGALGTANLDHMLSREKLTAPKEASGEGGQDVKGSTDSPSCGSVDDKPDR